MKFNFFRTASILAPMAAMVSACASTPTLNETNVTTSTALSSPTTDARPRYSATEQLAEDLVQAESAYERGARADLSLRLARIDQAGARFSAASEADPVNEWRSMAPDMVPPMRGRALGPAYTRGVVRAGQMMATDQIFLSGKSVSISVGTRPQAEIRLKVFDADAKIVCERSPAHARDCRFLPIFTQRYRIEILNSGDKDARYYLVVD